MIDDFLDNSHMPSIEFIPLYQSIVETSRQSIFQFCELGFTEVNCLSYSQRSRSLSPCPRNASSFSMNYTVSQPEASNIVITVFIGAGSYVALSVC